jgi:hypothetical protein
MRLKVLPHGIVGFPGFFFLSFTWLDRAPQFFKLGVQSVHSRMFFYRVGFEIFHRFKVSAGCGLDSGIQHVVAFIWLAHNLWAKIQHALPDPYGP